MTPAYVLLPLAALCTSRGAAHLDWRSCAGGAGMAAGNLSVATRVLMVVVMASSHHGRHRLVRPVEEPAQLHPWPAIGLMILALTATGLTEWAREVLRKPYAVRGVVYSSGVRCGAGA